jgi:hypothetical protein
MAGREAYNLISESNTYVDKTNDKYRMDNLGKRQRNGNRCDEVYVENDLRKEKLKMWRKRQIKKMNRRL